jgi:hypothetical protein
MKLLAKLILAVALAMGALSAVSAYRPTIETLEDLSPNQLAELTINKSQGSRLSDAVLEGLPAGMTDELRGDLYDRINNASNDQARALILSEYAPGHPLTQPGLGGFTQPVAAYTEGDDSQNKLSTELVAELKAAGLKRVTVKEFSFTRWQHWWLLAISVVALVGAGLLLKMLKPKPTDAGAEGPHDTMSPQQALDEIDRTLTAVRAAMHDEPDEHVSLKRIVADLGRLQLGPIDAVVSGREQFVNAHGLSAYAKFMDQFAGLERKINRAWSTAADNHLPEATAALDDAIALIESTQAQLPA